MAKKEDSKVFPFIIITILFFLWGGITSTNDNLIGTYQEIHSLSSLKSMFILMAFFGAYGIGALVYYLYSKSKGDPINKLGYKRGIIIGLIISGIGCLSVYPLTILDNYYASLTSFFIIGLGFTILQISCNPYIAILGSAKTASSRLNLSQGFNSLGTTIAPMIAGFIIFQYASKSEAIQAIYLVYGLLFFIFALLLQFIRLPEYKTEINTEQKSNALKFSHLRAGMLAIFFYVGAEVMIGGKLMAYVQLPDIGDLSKSEAASYLGIYWGGAMIGRLGISVISSNKFNFIKRVIYGFLTVLLSYMLVVLLFSIKTKILDLGLSMDLALIKNAFLSTLNDILPISWFILLQFIVMLLFRNSSGKLLSVFAGIIVLLLLFAFVNEGKVALWCILSIGLFNSILWSNIFTLSISGLKEHTSQASSLLIIMIIGGAILPLGMGWLTDHFEDLKIGYLFPIISYLYIFYFGMWGSRKKQIL